MLQAVEPIVKYLQHHPYIGEFLTFAIALVESLPILGTIFPGSIIMTAIGTLIGTSIMPPFTTIFAASLGAFAGDCIGFWMGRQYKEKIRTMWPFSKYPKWLSSSEKFFKHHGGKSIVIGRFFGPVRSTVPMIGGLLKLSWPRFLIAAIPSAVLWALLYMLPGALLGALAMELPPQETTEFLLTGLLIIVGLWFIIWFIQRFFRELAHFINSTIDRAWTWLNKHHSSKFFIRTIKDHQNPKNHHQLTLALVSIISLILFILLFVSLIHQSAISNWNKPLFYFIQSIHTKDADTFFIFISILGKPITMISISAIIAAFLAINKQLRPSTYLIFMTITTLLALMLIRSSYHIPRPTGFINNISSSSFPSGFSLFGLTSLGFLAFLTTKIVKKKWRWIIHTIAGILIFLIVLSQLYLGAHWLTDAVGGILLGVTILLGTILIYQRHPHDQEFKMSLPHWCTILLGSILIPWASFSTIFFESEKLSSTPYSVQFNINSMNWWNQPQEYVPTYRTNRFGTPVQPFNVQWMAELEEIKKNLISQGWNNSPYATGVKNALKGLTSYRPEDRQPLLPLLYLNKGPVLTAYKRLPNTKTIIELRLWSTEVHFYDNSTPLWIGTINLHSPPLKLLGFQSTRTISFTSPDVINALNGDLKKLANIVTKILHVNPNQIPSKVAQLEWQGEVLVIRSQNVSPK